MREVRREDLCGTLRDGVGGEEGEASAGCLCRGEDETGGLYLEELREG